MSTTRWLDIDGGNANTNIDIGDNSFISGTTYQAILGDDANTRAGYFTDGTRSITLADGADSASFTDGTTSVWLAGNYGAGDFDDGTNTVYLADGTYAVNAFGNSYFDGDVEITGTGTFGSVYTDIIYDPSTSEESVQVKNRILTSYYGVDVVNWENLNMRDLGTTLSIDWGDRKLYASDGSTVMLDWSTDGTADFKDNAITTTGTVTFGSTSAGIVLNDANSNFHIYGKTANDYGKVDKIGRAHV